MPLSPDDRQAIAGRAATVFDRAEAVARGRVANFGRGIDDAAHAALARWRQAFSPGDTAAFERRLAWDGLDTEAALQAIVTPADPAALDADHWTLWLDRILDEVPTVLADLKAGRWPAAVAEAAHPFAELRRPIRRAARRALTTALRAAAAEDDEGFSPFDLIDSCIFGDLERQLDAEVSRTAELAWFERFQSMPDATRDENSTKTYRTFVRALLEDLPGFFRAYPRLARQIATIMATWVESSTEMLVRLRRDRAAIGTTFAGGTDPGLLVHIDTALSDPHHGRRRVAILWFESGLRVVYKPRGIGVEVAFGRLLAWLNEGLDAPLRILRALDRGTHGWVEHAAAAPAYGLDEAVRYFRRAGALMCLTSVLGARDLHRDNLVAAAGGPVLVDLELLLQPGSPSARPTAGHDEMVPSCLSTGMLSLVDLGPDGEPHDAGGLRGECTGTLPLPTRVWFGSGTDALRFDHISTFSTSRTHELVVDGQVQRPESFAEAVVAGFSETYRYLVNHRAELLASGGPLDTLGRCRVRVLPRLTNQYAMMLSLLASPACQRDGVTAGCAIDVLHRSYAQSPDRPALWPVAVEERRALLALDVPHFTMRADETRASSGSADLDVDYFTVSGIESARRRISSLSAEGLVREAALLERALSESVRSVFATPPPAPRANGADRFIDDAEWIARELVDRAATTPSGLVWQYRRQPGGSVWRSHHLYDGTVGTALFFQALAHVTRAPRWEATADRVLEAVVTDLSRAPIQSASPDEPVGGASGLASVAYGLSLTASIGGSRIPDALIRELALGAAARVTADSPADVVNGIAGTALVLAALGSVLDDREIVAAAQVAAERLLDAAVPLDGGQLTWPGTDGTRLLGFAHGVTGMALALARVASSTTDRRFADASRGAFRFVAAHYHRATTNWPVAIRESDTAAQGTMNGWCHGAPGILTAVLSAGKAAAGELPIDIDAVLRGVAGWQAAQTDTLCCGNLSRVESLLVAARALDRTDLVDAARAIATRTVERAKRRGHFRLSGAGTDYRVFDPGFFQGLAGIGYELLRVARPADLPSVAAFDAPCAGVRYRSADAGRSAAVDAGRSDAGVSTAPGRSGMPVGPVPGRATLGA
jgi:type 2 lantibiotic biosynthesis protein LanM